MNKVSTTRVTLLAITLLASVLGFAGDFAETKATAPGVSAQVLSQPGLPIEITDVSLQSDIVTRETTLHYSVMNRAQEPLKQLSFFIVAFDSSGDVEGGQAACEAADVAPGAIQVRTLRLGNLLYLDPNEDYARVVVSVEGARTERAAWASTLEPTQVVAAMRDGDTAPVGRAGLGSLGTLAATCPLTFCDSCFDKAIAACKCGIKSFSCITNGSCTCSFTCQDRTPGCLQE